jgi:hypothetical protein
MHRDRDLLPWILSGLMMASLAIAIGAASIESFDSKNVRVSNFASEPAPLPATALADVLPGAPAIAAPVVSAPPIAEPAVLSAPAQPAGVPTQMAPPPSEPNGRIWECTSKGIKTFSDNPCGEKSTLREVGPINTMAPTPSVRYAGVNAPDPRYMPTYVNSYDEQDSSEPDQVESYDSYPVIQGFAYLPRIRALHPHRPIHHHHGKPVRKN